MFCCVLAEGLNEHGQLARAFLDGHLPQTAQHVLRDLRCVSGRELESFAQKSVC